MVRARSRSRSQADLQKRICELKNDVFQCFFFFVELNKTNEVKFWYSYFDVSMIMVIIIKKNKYLKKSHKIK